MRLRQRSIAEKSEFTQSSMIFFIGVEIGFALLLQNSAFPFSVWSLRKPDFYGHVRHVPFIT